MEISLLKYNLTIFPAPNENNTWAFGGLSSPKSEGLLGEVVVGPVRSLSFKNISGLDTVMLMIIKQQYLIADTY